VVDNDYRWGEFATLLAAASSARPQDRAAVTDSWWRDRGAIRRKVRSALNFDRRGDLESVLRIEFPAKVADAWLAQHPVATGITYGYVLFTVFQP